MNRTFNDFIKKLNKKTLNRINETLAVLLILFIGYILFLNNTPSLDAYNDGDVHRGFQRAVSILNGVNPYLEFNPNGMLIQNKVPGFFPLYFYFMALIARASNYSFVLFMDNLRYIVFAAYSCTGLAIYLLLRKKSSALALFGMCLYMFNRWTLGDAFNLKQDPYVISTTILSLWLLKRNRRLSFLLYGTATAIKHLTILISPIFAFEILALIALAWKNKGSSQALRKNVLEILLCVSLALIPIVIPSIPFIVQSPKNFFSSLMYNVTRKPEASGLQLDTGFDKVLVLYNQDKGNNFYYMLPRLPMVALMVLLIALYFKKKIYMWEYCALTYVVFVAFNPVLFGQYYTWMMGFLPLMLRDRTL